jgi:hypothetical protein
MADMGALLIKRVSLTSSNRESTKLSKEENPVTMPPIVGFGLLLNLVLSEEEQGAGGLGQLDPL